MYITEKMLNPVIIKKYILADRKPRRNVVAIPAKIFDIEYNL